ncbi:MAG TPA: FISUMP domain-containing protein, partial [Vicinamibacterales bacterium]|nr:FISUMP domain-containing protein [Vicinamibacterales bacterium]
RLYQWDTAVKACPAGWRLPTDRDWMDLEAALGMPAGDLGREGPRGSDQGAQLRARGRTRLEILISGYRRPAGDYARRNERAAFWTATESNAEDAWHRDIRGDVDTIYRSPVTKSYALSVRCIR